MALGSPTTAAYDALPMAHAEGAYSRPLPPGWVAEYSEDDGRFRFIDTLQTPPHVTYEDPRENDSLYPAFTATSRAPAQPYSAGAGGGRPSQPQQTAQKPSSSRLLNDAIVHLSTNPPTNLNTTRTPSIAKLALRNSNQRNSVDASSLTEEQQRVPSQWQRVADTVPLSKPHNIENNLSATAGVFLSAYSATHAISHFIQPRPPSPRSPQTQTFLPE